jgi:hypothetical protein
MTRLARRVLIAATMTALTLAPALPAHAESDTVKDKRADVMFLNPPFRDSLITFDRRKSIRSGVDVTSASIAYSPTTVTVKIRFARLTSELVRVGVGVQVRGGADKNRGRLGYTIDNLGQLKTLGVTPYLRDGVWTKGPVCNAKMTTKAGRGGTIRIRVPSSCLGRPEQLRASVTAGRGIGRADDVDPVDYLDIVSPSHVKQKTMSRWLTAD